MLGSHTVQQQLCVCLETAKQEVLIPALLVPGGFGISLPICVDSDPHKKVEAVRFCVHVDTLAQNTGWFQVAGYSSAGWGLWCLCCLGISGLQSVPQGLLTFFSKCLECCSAGSAAACFGHYFDVSHTRSVRGHVLVFLCWWIVCGKR